MWDDSKDTILKLFEKDNEFFPRICPCCGKESGHIFFHKFNEKDIFGSAWAWCSSCQEFSHSRYLIPEWWENLESIDIENIDAEPSFLDSNKDEIDKWVNSLIQNNQEKN